MTEGLAASGSGGNAVATEAPAADAGDVLRLVDLAATRDIPRASAGALIRGVVARAAPDEPLSEGEPRRAARCVVDAGGEPIAAQQAESCVLRPEPGDVVLVSVAPAEPSYVLAVLERPGAAPRVWRAPGGDAVKVSAERVELEGARSVSVRAPELEIGAAAATLAFRAVTVTSELVRGASEKLEWVTRRLQTVADWSVHRAGNYVRSVESSDTVEAEHVTRTARGAMISTSTNTVLIAKEDVRVDGKRIHMG